MCCPCFNNFTEYIKSLYRNKTMNELARQIYNYEKRNK